MLELWKNFWTDQSGQDLSEYALLLVLIAAALVTLIIALQNEIKSAFSRVTSALNTGNLAS